MSMYGEKPKGWAKHMDFILLDVICLHIAFVLAFMTRHGFDNPYGDPNYLNAAVVYTLTDLLIIVLNSTMKDVVKRGYYKEMAETVKHVILVSLFFSFYLFSTQEGEAYSRITFYLMGIYYIGLGYAVRVLWKRFLRHARKGMDGAAVYFITTSDRAAKLIHHFQMNSLSAYTLQGVCILDQDCVGREICGIPVTASADTVLNHLCDRWVDEVFISVPDDYAQPTELIESIAEMGIVIHVEIEPIKNMGWQHQIIEHIADRTVWTVSMTMATQRQIILKRALDIAGGIVGCILTGVLTLIIGPLIFIKSPGPIFFSQIRVGRNGKKFKLYKFRSMYLDAEERKAELMQENRIKDGLMFKLEFDPRIIGCKKLPDGTIKKGIGNFIRDWSLDEFPQFFNVLKGDLSLCGTRPPTVDEWEKYELHHRARLAIKPGITGMWQVSGRSKITDFEQVVELDKKYIREWSMGLDFRILLETIKVVLRKDGSM